MSRALTVSQAAEILGVSRSGVIKLDGRLKPRRCECGGRLYDPARVDELAGERSVLKGNR